MANLVLNVYDKSGEIVKTSEAKMIDLEFGTIESLMELLNIEEINVTTDLLKTVYGAWDELTNILSQCFPDMEKSDWKHVKLKELIPLVINILKYSFEEILTIPNDSKN